MQNILMTYENDWYLKNVTWTVFFIPALFSTSFYTILWVTFLNKIPDPAAPCLKCPPPLKLSIGQISILGMYKFSVTCFYPLPHCFCPCPHWLQLPLHNLCSCKIKIIKFLDYSSYNLTTLCFQANWFLFCLFCFVACLLSLGDHLFAIQMENLYSYFKNQFIYGPSGWLSWLSF